MWIFGLQNFDVILVPNPYLALSFCCYLTPFDFDDIVKDGGRRVVWWCFSPV